VRSSSRVISGDEPADRDDDPFRAALLERDAHG
jgi:hypothetical protein